MGGRGGGGKEFFRTNPSHQTYIYMCGGSVQGGGGRGRLALRTNPRTAHIYVSSVWLLGGWVAAARRPNIMSIISIRIVIITIVSILIA